MIGWCSQRKDWLELPKETSRTAMLSNMVDSKDDEPRAVAEAHASFASTIMHIISEERSAKAQICQYECHSGQLRLLISDKPERHLEQMSRSEHIRDFALGSLRNYLVSEVRQSKCLESLDFSSR